MQEEVLKKTVTLAKQLDAQLVKQAILPRVHGLALKTTVAAVRVNALLCLGDMVHILDKRAVLDILQTIQRCTAVDRSAPTLMCTLGVANSIVKQNGIEFAAEHVLPLLAPLLVAQQLNVQQFAKYMLFVKDILRKIEDKRGVTVTDSGIPEVRPSPAAVDARNSEQVKRTISPSQPTTKSSPSWDEDWVPTTKGSSSTLQSTLTNLQPVKPTITNKPIQAQSLNISSVSTQQTEMSCPPVDIEWPPRLSSGVTSQLGENEQQNQSAGMPASCFDDIDPFANWPPRPTGSLSTSVSSKNGTVTTSSTSNGLSQQNNDNLSWAFTTQSSVEPFRQNQGNATLNAGSFNSGGLNSQSSLGFMKQNQGISGNYYGDKRTTDLGSIFASSKSEQSAPRLAPPPATAVGRGRGRGRGSQGQSGNHSASRSSHAKPPSEQPPLLDLL